VTRELPARSVVPRPLHYLIFVMVADVVAFKHSHITCKCISCQIYFFFHQLKLNLIAPNFVLGYSAFIFERSQVENLSPETGLYEAFMVFLILPSQVSCNYLELGRDHFNTLIKTTVRNKYLFVLNFIVHYYNMFRPRSVAIFR
jgi:hypothetical protein